MSCVVKSGLSEPTEASVVHDLAPCLAYHFTCSGDADFDVSTVSTRKDENILNRARNQFDLARREGKDKGLSHVHYFIFHNMA